MSAELSRPADVAAAPTFGWFFDRSPGGEATAPAILPSQDNKLGLDCSRPNEAKFARHGAAVVGMARQLWRYMDAVIEVESQSVQAYFVFPSAPSDIYVRRVVEMILAERGIVTLWWAQQETTPDEFMDAGTDGSPDALTLLIRLAAQFLTIDGVVPPTPPWFSRSLAFRGTPIPQGQWTPLGTILAWPTRRDDLAVCQRNIVWGKRSVGPVIERPRRVTFVPSS